MVWSGFFFFFKTVYGPVPVLKFSDQTGPENRNQLSKALSQSLPLAPKTVHSCTTPPILEGESDDHKKIIFGNSFSFATSATSQLILECIMSQSVSSHGNTYQVKISFIA